MSGFFPSFARATGSLSVSREYLALRDGPRRFRRAFTCPVLLRCRYVRFPCRLRGCHPLWPLFPESSTKVRILKTGPTTLQGQVPAVWADPRSLAATDGVAFAFLSSGYGDVSVPRVGPAQLWIHCAVIRAPRPQRSVDSSAGIIAVFHALHRLLAPRYPPHALSSLAALTPP